MNYLLILFLFLILLLSYYIYKIKKQLKIKIQKNEQTKILNDKIKKQNEVLTKEQVLLKNNIERYNEELFKLQKQILHMEETSKNAFQEYNQLLENNYKNTDEEYDFYIKKLQESYNNIQEQKTQEIKEIQNQLNTIKNTRAAAIEALKKEKEIKEKRNFYCISLDEIDKKEIKVIESIESLLRDDRHLKMMIWSNYYLRKVNLLCSNVLGSNIKTGIYKITENDTGLSYIGQAKDIKERFRDHIKHGLGIDTPANNKLYNAMQQSGIENFSFEILEECSEQQLNEKEKFYIDLYQTYDYGFNSNKGIGKNKYI